MFLDATLLIQDVQLLCFTVVFGVLAFQRWSDPMRRWLLYVFLANSAGAVIDLSAAHLPFWVSHALNQEMMPFSYALLNVAFVFFTRRRNTEIWLSMAFIVLSFPLFLAWMHRPTTIWSDALGDLLIALESIIAAWILFANREAATRAPRILLGGFFIVFIFVELARFCVAFILHGDPDVTTPRLQIISAVTYIVNVSLMPLCFLWMLQARTEGHLLHQSIIDPLTGILNRRGLDQALTRELARSQRFGSPLTLVILDLDYFKAINDRHGHAVGDAILYGVATFLTGRIRQTDTLARLGGEEFVLLFPHADISVAGNLVEELCRKLREWPSFTPDGDHRVTASFGVACSSMRRPIGAQQLLQEADVALYQAKAAGRDRVQIYTPTDAVLS
ncbi:GGDEF domain-containing protein [Silvibacterium sp.]|uniref:GGDEF domain-containing protein n=1 Tax=Silvibacterium sp. TaxID=1964179 RepID=UPI0039E31D16